MRKLKWLYHLIGRCRPHLVRILRSDEVVPSFAMRNRKRFGGLQRMGKRGKVPSKLPAPPCRAKTLDPCRSQMMYAACVKLFVRRA